MENRQIVPIVFATDERFVPYCSVAVASIQRNASADKDYRIYIFHDSLTEQSIALLEGMHMQNVQVSCLDVSEQLPSQILYEVDNRYTRPIYFRLFIPSMLPMYEKVLYLDSDVVAVVDVAELFETNLNGMVLGAVTDLQHPLRQKETQQQVGLDASQYFNSGVLLINCRAFTQERIKERCYELLSTRRSFRMPDQDALNLVCLGKVVYLPYRWNLLMGYGKWPYHYQKMSEYNLRYEESLAHPAILHYSGDHKPDATAYLGLNSYFWQYAMDSPCFSDLFTKWIGNGKRKLSPEELLEATRESMASGQRGWRGLWQILKAGFRSRMQYRALAKMRKHQSDKANPKRRASVDE